MPLCRHSEGTYQEMSSHATHQGTLSPIRPKQNSVYQMTSECLIHCPWHTSLFLFFQRKLGKNKKNEQFEKAEIRKKIRMPDSRQSMQSYILTNSWHPGIQEETFSISRIVRLQYPTVGPHCHRLAPQRKLLSDKNTNNPLPIHNVFSLIFLHTARIRCWVPLHWQVVLFIHLGRRNATWSRWSGANPLRTDHPAGCQHACTQHANHWR